MNRIDRATFIEKLSYHQYQWLLSSVELRRKYIRFNNRYEAEKNDLTYESEKLPLFNRIDTWIWYDDYDCFERNAKLSTVDKLREDKGWLFPSAPILPPFSRAYRLFLCIAMSYIVFRSLIRSLMDDASTPFLVNVMKLHNVIPIILAVNYGFGIIAADKHPHELYMSLDDNDIASSSLIDMSIDAYDPKYSWVNSWKWYYILT